MLSRVEGLLAQSNRSVSVAGVAKLPYIVHSTVVGGGADVGRTKIALLVVRTSQPVRDKKKPQCAKA